MSLLLALVLAQPMNLNQQPIMVKDEGTPQGSVRAITVNCVGAGVTCTQSGSTWTVTVAGGGGGAPTSATYITQTPDATLSAEQALSALATGIVVNTTATGVLTIYTGATCTNQFIRALSASGAATCTSVNLATDVTGLLPDSNLASNYSGVGACSANQYAHTLNDNAAPTCSQVAYSQVSGTPTIPTDISGSSFITRTSEANLSNETALNGISTGLLLNTAGTLSAKATNTCTNQFPRSDNASGVWTCASVSVANDVTGTLAQANGGTGAGALTCAAGERLTSNGSAYSCSAVVTQAYTTVEDEGSGLTQRSTVNFTGSGVSCADSGGKTVCTVSGGGGGGGNWLEQSIALSGGSGFFQQVVTGQTWVTASSTIVCGVLGTTADSLTPEVIGVAGLVVTVSDRVAGTGFTINVFSPYGLDGTVRVHCTGA